MRTTGAVLAAGRRAWCVVAWDRPTVRSGVRSRSQPWLPARRECPDTRRRPLLWLAVAAVLPSGRREESLSPIPWSSSLAS